MKLPPVLIRFRSGLAAALAGLLRVFRPLARRVAMFCYEVWARSQMRGPIAPGVQFFGAVRVEGSGAVSIGRGTRLGKYVYFETGEGGRIEIGENCVINSGATIVAYENIVIGDYVMMGEYATIRDANHGIKLGTPIRHQPHEAAAVTIGQDAWIARGACVLKGVTVGSGAVIGANSVVTRDVDPNSIVAGAPARPIGARET